MAPDDAISTNGGAKGVGANGHIEFEVAIKNYVSNVYIRFYGNDSGTSLSNVDCTFSQITLELINEDCELVYLPESAFVFDANAECIIPELPNITPLYLTSPLGTARVAYKQDINKYVEFLEQKIDNLSVEI